MSLGARTPLALRRVLLDKKTAQRLAAVRRHQAENVNPRAADDICRLAEQAVFQEKTWATPHNPRWCSVPKIFL